MWPATSRIEAIVTTHLTDSAGQAWAGREFHANPWADDDGSAPADLAAALHEFHRGAAPLTRVVAALRATRLLVPLIAELGAGAPTPAGLVADKQADLSIVTVRAPDGRGAVPLFTSVVAMGRWDAAARPVPVASRQAALAVVEEGSELIILDPGSDTETVIRRPALWAIARDTPYEVPWQHPRVLEVAASILQALPAVASVDVLPGDAAARMRGPEVMLVLGILPQQDAQLAAKQAGSILLEAPELVEIIDTIEVKIILAEEQHTTGARRFRKQSRR